MGGSQTTPLSASLYSAVNLNNSAGDEDSEWLELGEDEGKEQYDPELLKQLDNWFNPQQPDNSVSAAGSYLPNNNNVGGGADDANGLGAFPPFIFPADSGGARAGVDDIDNNIRDFFEYDDDGDADDADDDAGADDDVGGADDDVGGADDDLDAFDFDPDDDDFDYHYGGRKNFYKKKKKKQRKGIKQRKEIQIEIKQKKEIEIEIEQRKQIKEIKIEIKQRKEIFEKH